VVYFGGQQHVVLLAIGLGIIAYACAVAFYTLLGIWRMRRASLRDPATAWKLSESPGVQLPSASSAEAATRNRRDPAERTKLLDVTAPAPIQPQRQ
jgi:hypothetical protein